MIITLTNNDPHGLRFVFCCVLALDLTHIVQDYFTASWDNIGEKNTENMGTVEPTNPPNFTTIFP